MEPKHTILYAEDNRTFRECMSEALRMHYDVIVASDGDEVFAKLNENPSIELLLSDNRMPGHTGIELAALTEKPVIIYSYDLRKSDKEKLSALLNVYAIFDKNEDGIDKVIETIDDVLNKTKK